MLLATASEVQKSKARSQNNLRGLSHISPTSLQPLHCSVLSAVWRLSSISYKDKRNDEKQAISGLYCVALEALASVILYMKEKADSFRCTLELFFSFFLFFLFDLVSHCRKFGLEFHLMRRYIVFESITFMVTIPAGRSRIWQTAAGERTYTVRASQMSLTHEITPSDCLDLILLHEYKTTAVETLILTLIALVSLQRVTCRHLC